MDAKLVIAGLKPRSRSTGRVEWCGMVNGWSGSRRIKSDNQPKQLGLTTFFWGFLTVR